MQLSQTFNQLQFLDYLIRKKATGTPKQLAARMNLSERHTYRIIYDLKQLGFPIKYDIKRRSYYYDGEVQMSVVIRVDSNTLVKISSDI